MFIQCSDCDYKYIVNSADLKPDGIMVECANCNHRWYQELLQAEELISPSLPSTSSEKTATDERYKKNDEKKILIFVGVNGSGKTTTIGKIANKILSNKKILIAACDTFRAAAVEQLENWAKKNNNGFIAGKSNQDPASVAYQATEEFGKENYDFLLIDTAGRLSNNTNLINQLIKLKNVISKVNSSFNIETVLVLDGTNGSNMIKQVEIFGNELNVSSLIITKLDGTAKGGALISIANKFEIPISYVGLGESIEDLVTFNSQNFARSILNLEEQK